MSAIGLRRLGLIVALLLHTALLNAALPTNGDEAPAPPSLAGQLLVAAPSMGDPRFERTVILIIQHSPSGALGIVINKPIGETSIARVFEALGQKGSDVAGDVRVFSGGPVQPEVGFVVHSADYRRPETIAVNDRLSMTSSLAGHRRQERAGQNSRGLRLHRLGTEPARTRNRRARLGDCGRRSSAGVRRGQGQSLGSRLEASHPETLNAGYAVRPPHAARCSSKCDPARNRAPSEAAASPRSSHSRSRRGSARSRWTRGAKAGRLPQERRGRGVTADTYEKAALAPPFSFLTLVSHVRSFREAATHCASDDRNPRAVSRATQTLTLRVALDGGMNLAPV